LEHPLTAMTRGSLAGIGAGVLGVETAHQFSAGLNREFEPLELHRVFHAVLEFVGMERDRGPASRPAAGGTLVQRAIGEHVLEPPVRMKQKLGPNLHHAAEIVVAGERGIGGSAGGRARGGRRDNGQQASGDEGDRLFENGFLRSSTLGRASKRGLTGNETENKAWSLGRAGRPRLKQSAR
jgi:hypothetical protein